MDITLVKNWKSLNSTQGRWAWFGAKETLRLIGMAHHDFQLFSTNQNCTFTSSIIILPYSPTLQEEEAVAFKDFVARGGVLITESILPGDKSSVKTLGEFTETKELKISAIFEHEGERVFNGVSSKLPLLFSAPLKTANYETFGKVVNSGGAEGALLAKIPVGNGLIWYLCPGFFATVGLLLSAITSEFAPRPDPSARKVFSFEQHLTWQLLAENGFFGPVTDEWLLFWENLIDESAAFLNIFIPRISYLPYGKKASVFVGHPVDEAKGDKDYLEKWLALEEMLGIHSTWWLISMIEEDIYPLRIALSDSCRPKYHVGDRKIIEWARANIRRGSEIGIHHANWRGRVVKAEYDKFVRETGLVPTSVAPHWMQGSTEALLTYEEIGYVGSSCLASNDSWEQGGKWTRKNPNKYPGFTSGTTRIHDYFNYFESTLLNLVEAPSMLEDLWAAGKQEKVPQWEDICEFLTIIEYYGGVCFLNWHQDLYKLHPLLVKIIEHLKQRKVWWFATLRDIVRRWKNTRKIKIEKRELIKGEVELILLFLGQIKGLTINIPGEIRIKQEGEPKLLRKEKLEIRGKVYTQIITDHTNETRMIIIK